MERYVVAAVIAFLVMMFGSLAISEYTKGQCRTAGIAAGKTAEDIQKICR